MREEWHKYKKALPQRIADAILETAEIKTPEYVAGMVAGADSPSVAYIGAGLALAIVTFKGRKIWRAFKEGTTGPFSYLSRIETTGATLVAGPAAC